MSLYFVVLIVLDADTGHNTKLDLISQLLHGYVHVLLLVFDEVALFDEFFQVFLTLFIHDLIILRCTRREVYLRFVDMEEVHVVAFSHGASLLGVEDVVGRGDDLVD